MSIRLIIADDHRIVRDGLRALLARQPDVEVVAECGTGREAVRLAKEHQPEAVIMDVGMPDVAGPEATAEIRAALPSTKVVALSMHTDKQFVLGMFQAGASAYLLKESAFEELARAIRLVVANEVYVSGGILTTVVNEAVQRATGVQSVPRPLLTPREQEVLKLLGGGCSTKATAAQLGISVQTVSAHRARILEKLNLHSAAELIRYAIQEGLVPL